MNPVLCHLLFLCCFIFQINGSDYRTPISTAAALEFGWPFSHELCVAYAMIMSTAGILLHHRKNKKKICRSKCFRNRIYYNSYGVGIFALPTRRLLPGQT